MRRHRGLDPRKRIAFVSWKESGSNPRHVKIKDGLIEGPDFSLLGRALSQTGEHGNFRSGTENRDVCHCQHTPAFTSRIADGIDDVRRAVREELRKGTDQIKIMVLGGASSPHDPLKRNQYSPSEMKKPDGAAPM